MPRLCSAALRSDAMIREWLEARARAKGLNYSQIISCVERLLMIKKLTGLTNIKLSPLDEGKRVRLHFHFGENKRQPDLELEMPAEDLMAWMTAFQRFQTRHRIPIPPSLRPQGPPLVSIVSTDETD